MRVGIISLMHETNTFVSGTTGREQFARDVLLSGSAIREHFRGGHHEISGFFHVLEENGVEVVPIFAARSVPSGIITADLADALITQMLTELERAGDLDGVMAAPHGAGVAENHRDLDGYWLCEVRKRVGGIPMICTLDMHANVSQAMVDACNATIAYRTNPHLDQEARGAEAAELMVRTLRGEIQPTQAAAFPPIAINIERQLTSMSPCRELIEFADAMRSRPGVLSNSVVLGFPYADVAEMGSSFITVTDNDPKLARHLSQELAKYVMDRRQDFVPHLVSPDEAVEKASHSKGAVLLLDMGDNMGGGAPADGTILAHAILRHKFGPAFVSINDPQAQSQARNAGAGTELTLHVGAKHDNKHGSPIVTKVRVVSLHEGRFSEPNATHGGWSQFDMGPTAIVETPEGLTIQITSRRTFPVSLGQLISCGIDPARFRALVAKGVNAPVAAYSAVCSSVIRVNTPGVTTADMTTLHYDHRRRPLFPFEA